MGDDLRTVDLVRRAHAATVAAGIARVLAVTEHDFALGEPPRRRGTMSGPRRFVANAVAGVLWPVGAVAKFAGRRLWKLVGRGVSFRRQEAEGVIDFKRRRYAVDYGGYSRMYVDGQEWTGRSGRARLTLWPRADVVPTPLWLVDLVAGVTHADDDGTAIVRGATCRHISARVDVSRASAATPGGMAVPARGSFDDLLSLPVEVWVDDTQVRRVRYEGDGTVETVDLWDFGVRIKALDWTYMPTFRSPHAAPGRP
jgi:hypothetical protein